MVIGIIGENCSGKSTLAACIRDAIGAEIITGKDYLRMAKSEPEARRLLQENGYPDDLVRAKKDRLLFRRFLFSRSQFFDMKGRRIDLLHFLREGLSAALRPDGPRRAPCRKRERCCQQRGKQFSERVPHEVLPPLSDSPRKPLPPRPRGLCFTSLNC